MSSESDTNSSSHSQQAAQAAHETDSDESMNQLSDEESEDQSFFRNALRFSTGISDSFYAGPISSLLTNLNRDKEPIMVLENLTELSETLLMMNGAMLDRSISPEYLCNTLVSVLNDLSLVDHLEIQLMCCRCCYNLIEASPEHVDELVAADIVSALQEKLQQVSYIDLAEVALQTLEVVSRQDPDIVLSCLDGAFQFLDFLTTYAQRKALCIAANAAKRISRFTFSSIKNVLPSISNVAINYSDNICVENAWLAICRTVDRCGLCAEDLESIISEELLRRASQLVVECAGKNNNLVSFSTCLKLLTLIGQCCRISTKISVSVLLGGLPSHMIEFIGKRGSELSIESVMAAPQEVILGFLSAICQALPRVVPLDKDLEFFGCVGETGEDVAKLQQLDQSSFQTQLKQFLQAIVVIYSSTADNKVRQCVLVSLSRCMSIAISEHARTAGVTRLLASIVIQFKSALRTESSFPVKQLTGSLMIIDSLLERRLFVEQFHREGLFNDVSGLVELLRNDKSQDHTHLVKVCTSVETRLISLMDHSSTKLDHMRLVDEVNRELCDFSVLQSYSYQEWASLWDKICTSVKDISSFEIVSSGLLESLQKFFSLYEPASVGYKSFQIAFCGSKNMVTFVSKLQEAFSRTESFEIVSSGVSVSTSALAKQVKLQLASEDGSVSMYLVVHAIATFRAVSQFLKLRFGTANDFEYLINDQVVPLDTTVFGAIYRSVKSDMAKLWSHRPHTVIYKTTEPSESKDSFASLSDEALSLHPHSTVVLSLLKRLSGMERDKSIFVNYRLAAKLNRQLEDPLVVASGILPVWSVRLTCDYPFLFPIETRILFLRSTSYGYSRLIQMWQSRQDDSSEEKVQLGRPARHKVRISRKQLLPSAFKVLDMYATIPSILEIEFFDEVGTGLGPTLEFYTDVSKEFSHQKMWRKDSGELFPRPDADCHLFSLLGKFIARAMLDSRILDFAFNPVFFELAHSFSMNESVTLLHEKLFRIDPALYRSIQQLNHDNVSGLCLHFNLPGYPETELIENGGAVEVSDSNLEQYIALLVDTTVCVTGQVEAFVKGFSTVFPYNSLLIFSPQELVLMLGSETEDWSFDTIFSCVKADHGYNMESRVVMELITLMSEFSSMERRQFLQFITGAAKLPVGGFKGLSPELTVVRKSEEDDLTPDDYLPSVMTCANYLKLPEYSSKEVMRQRISQAMQEGANTFLLS